MVDGPVADVLDLLVVMFEVGHQFDRNVVRDDVGVSQNERIFHKLSSRYGRDDCVIVHQLLGQQVPVVCVVVDPEVAAQLLIGQDPPVT